MTKLGTTGAESENVATPVPGWSSAPNPPTSGYDPPPKKHTIPTFRYTGESRVDELVDRLPYEKGVWQEAVGVPLKCEVDPTRWATTTGGKVLVAATYFNETVWVDRSYLVDPAYPATVARIDEIRKREDDELADFWAEKANGEFGVGKTVTLVHDTVGVQPGKDGPGEPSIVPAGKYEIHEHVQWRADPTQRAPFSVLVRVGETAVALSPDTAGGVETAHVEAAVTQGLAKRVDADDLCLTFKLFDNDDFARNRPANVDLGWLTDDQIQYVDDHQMGKLYVQAVEPWLANDQSQPGTALRLRAMRVGELTAGLRLGQNIYVKQTAMGTGVEYHEALHRMSANGVQHALGPDFNEGVTEYFTRLVLTRVDTVVRSPDTYAEQLAGVQALLEAKVITPAVLAAAYFKGAVWQLFGAVEEHPALGGRFSLQGYAHRLGGGNGGAARAHLEAMLAKQ